MGGTRLCIRDGIIPAEYRCPICGDGFTLVGHDPVITLVTTTHPVCRACAEKLAPRLSAVLALWKSASAEQRWPSTPSDGG